MKSLLVYKKHEKQSHAKRQGVLVLLNRAVKTGGPALNGPALTDFGLYRAGPKSPVEKRA